MIISLEIKNDIVEKRYYKEPTKISVLSSGKIDKYKYVTDEELQLSYQSRIIEQAKFTYSTLGKKPFRKTNKVIEDQEEKTNKRNRNQNWKTTSRHRSKIYFVFVFKRFFDWRSYMHKH